MKCQSCEEIVSSKFVFAISQNSCPFCGQLIMSTALQKDLNDLREVMTSATNSEHLSAVLDWLHSNFDLIAIDGEEITTLNEKVALLNSELETSKKELQETKEQLKYSKPTPKSGKVAAATIETDPNVMALDEEGHEVQVSGENIQDPNVTQSFLNRAQVNRFTTKGDKLKQMVKQIKSKSMVTEGDQGLTMDQASRATPEELEALEGMISGSMPSVTSAIDMDYDDDDALPPIAEAMIRGNASAGSGYNAKDVALLQKLQSKSASASRSLDRGGSVGMIKR